MPTTGTPAHDRLARKSQPRPHNTGTPSQHRNACTPPAHPRTGGASAHGRYTASPPARRRHARTPPERLHNAGPRPHHRHGRRQPAHLLTVGTLADHRPTRLTPARSPTNRSPTTRRLSRQPPARPPTSAFPSGRSNLRGSARPLEHPPTSGTCSDVGPDRRRRRRPPTSVHVFSSFSGGCDVGRGEMPFFSCCTAAQCSAAVLDASVSMFLPLLIYYRAEACLSLLGSTLRRLLPILLLSSYMYHTFGWPSHANGTPFVKMDGCQVCLSRPLLLLQFLRVTSAHLFNIHYWEGCIRGNREVIHASSTTASPPCAFLYRVPVAGVVLDACCFQYSRYTGISLAEMLSPSTPCAQTGVESLLELLVGVKVAPELLTFRMGILFSMLMARVPLVYAP